VHGLCQTYDSLRNYFEHTRWYSYVMGLKWMLISVRLEMALFLTQDRVHSFALDIPQAQKSFWTHPIEHLGDVGHVESHFGSFRDNVSIGAR
jgi:hypothetical protein